MAAVSLPSGPVKAESRRRGEERRGERESEKNRAAWKLGEKEREREREREREGRDGDKSVRRKRQGESEVKKKRRRKKKKK